MLVVAVTLRACSPSNYPGGVTKQFSIRAELKPQVQQWLKNYQLLKAKLEAICEMNHVFLRPEE